MIGLSSNLYEVLLGWFFKTKTGVEFSNTYGVSFDPSIRLKEIPVILPEINAFYELAKDLTYFEVIEHDSENDKVTIREICTDNEYVIDVKLFDNIFIKRDAPDIVIN